jgi:DNA (cytosine-5)-methyltransferase 1
MKTNQTDSQNPTVMGLFAGCGGLDLGFKKAGFDIVYANDNERSVKETYEHNLGPIDICDIREVNKDELPYADVVLAGIPCQPFSSAGNRGSMNDIRGTLFNEVIVILKKKQPKVVLFENVRGFLSAKDDSGNKMPDRVAKDLKKIGYNFYYKLLNASDYGVPQNRNRVVMLGVRKDIDNGFEFPEPIPKKKLTVGDVIGKKAPKNEIMEVWDLSPQSMKVLEFIPEGGSWKNIPTEHLPERLKKIRREIKRYKSPNFYRRFSRDEIMGTVTAAATPENSGILHPLENRRYSVREIARFQSFPDTFKFKGESTSKKYKMIGNAVPVNLAHNIAIALKKQYFS